MDKPIYTVDFMVSGCNHKLFINDVLISESDDGDQLSAQLSVNQWLRNGSNELILEMTALEQGEKLSHTAIGRLNVLCVDGDNLFAKGSNIESGKSPRFSDESNAEVPTSFKFGVTFSAKLPFEEAAFHRSKPFDIEQDREKILETFRGIWRLHQEQNWYELNKLEERKIHELAACYFDQANTIRQMNRDNFDTTIGDGYRLVQFDESCLDIQLMANSKLATVLDSAGYPAIFYDHIDGTRDLYPYWVFKNENDEFQIIR